MASSSISGDYRVSVGYAQDFVTVKCDLCDAEKDVTSHCTECAKSMCVKCEQVHNKLHTDHKIITVFEYRIVQHLNTKCQSHDLAFSFYCENCQINICNKCRRTTHRKCNLVDIDEHAEMLKIAFTKRVDQQREHLPEIDEISDTIKDLLAHFDKKISSQINLIEELTEKIHKNLDVQKSDLIKQVSSKQTWTHKTLKDQIQALQDINTSIDNITASIETQINLVSDAGVLQLVNEGNTEIDSTLIKMNIEIPNPITFAPSTLWDHENKLLGSLKKDKDKVLIFDSRLEPPDTM